MRALLKTILIWMVMLAAPLQGVAAAAMLHCGAGHHTQSPGHEMPMDPAVHGHMGHAADDAEAGASSAGTCSACASCFWGAAIIGTQPVAATAAVGASPLRAVETDMEAVVPDGLERPPRAV